MGSELAAGDAGRRWARLAAGGGCAALALTAGAPMGALLWGPIVFGVPHLVGDVWVLVRRPGSARAAVPWVVAPLVCMVLLRAVALAGVVAPPWVEPTLGTAAVVLGALSTRSPTRVVLAAAACAPAWVFASHAALVLAHLHNLIALGFLVALAPTRVAAPLCGVALAGGALVATGALDARLGVGVQDAAGLSAYALARSLAPGIASPWSDRLVLGYCFAQMLHYLCWIVLLPALARDAAASAPRPFLHAMRADLGPHLLALGAVAALALPLAALASDAPAVRAAYLSFATFHGWMELAVLAAWAHTRPAGSQGA